MVLEVTSRQSTISTAYVSPSEGLLGTDWAGVALVVCRQRQRRKDGISKGRKLYIVEELRTLIVRGLVLLSRAGIGEYARAVALSTSIWLFSSVSA